jgi:molybdopterin-containing oxidoreductase family membrane subunit
MAGISGTGLIILVAYILRKIYRLDEVIGEKAFYTLGFMLFVLCVIYLYFTIVEELTAHYAAPEKDRYIAHQITIGKFAPVFWINVLCLILPAIFLFYQTVSRKVNIALTALAGVVVNVSAVLKRFLIVVPSQTHGLYLPYQEGNYFPALSEIMILLGIVGFGILLFVLFGKIFPIIPLEVLEEKKIE